MTDFNGSHRPPSEDDQMRALLHDAVSDIEPPEALDSIRAGTNVSPFRSRRPWLLGAGAAVLATAATITAVAVMGGNPGTTAAPPSPDFAGSDAPTIAKSADAEPSTRPSAEPSSEPSTDPSGEPSTQQSTEPSPSADDAAGAATTTVPVYYVGETWQGPRLFREFHQVQATDDARPKSAVNEAVATKPADADYRSDWPAGTRVDQVNFDGTGDDGTITVHLENSSTNLRPRPDDLSADQATMAVEQLIYTAQAATQTRAPVQFLLGGERTDTVLGVPASEPLAQGDAASTLAMVWVIAPAEGAEVTSPFKVEGLANAFEANVQWELMQGDTVVRKGFTTATEAFTMAPYEFTVKAPPGEYTLVVHDSDASGRGNTWQDTKSITVTN